MNLAKPYVSVSGAAKTLKFSCNNGGYNLLATANYDAQGNLFSAYLGSNRGHEGGLLVVDAANFQALKAIIERIEAEASRQ